MVGISNNQNTNDVNDGFFELDYREDGIFLIVYPPVEKGRKVQLNDVLDRLAGKKSLIIDKQVAAGVVSSMGRKPVKIGDLQEESKIDAVGEIILTPDKIKAYFSAKPPEGGRKLL
jgi:uncharacterized protein